jgi:hypothetical protein
MCKKSPSPVLQIPLQDGRAVVARPSIKKFQSVETVMAMATPNPKNDEKPKPEEFTTVPDVLQQGINL